MAYLSWLLMWFEAILGLEINLAKREIILVRSVDDVEALALELGCKIGVFPSSYLGLPLGALHNLMAVWDNIEERFRKKTSFMEEAIYLKRGEIHSPCSTLSSLPIYYMSLFRLPRRVKLRLEQIQRDFL